MPTKDSTFQPVIIIGAARSGTNMLRDLLTQVPSVGSWPFDETNYIWQSPLADLHHDELGAEHADTCTIQRVRRTFQKLARREQCQYVMEKSCVNSLRVDYINAILPNAKFIFLVRDGRDVVLSSLKEWAAPRDPPQWLKRISYLPLYDMPYWGSHFATRRMQRMSTRKNPRPDHPRTWGPRFQGIERAIAEYPQEEVCALQWQHSVEQASHRLKSLPHHRVLTIQYEKLVNHPAQYFEGVLDFLGINFPASRTNHIVSEVFSAGAGRWRTSMSGELCTRIEDLVGSTLSRFNYPLSKIAPIERVA